MEISQYCKQKELQCILWACYSGYQVLLSPISFSTATSGQVLWNPDLFPQVKTFL